MRKLDELEWIKMIKKDIADLTPDTISPPPRILLGAEIDPDPIKMDGSFIVEVPDLDYIILSIHMIPGIGIGAWRFSELNYDEFQRRDLGRIWLDWLGICIENGSFNILGHPLRFPIELDLLDIQDDRTFDECSKVLCKLAARNHAFEINNGLAYTLFNRGLLDVYSGLVTELKNAGVKFARGSDSHSSKSVGEWEFGRMLAETAGLGEEDWVDPKEWLI